MNTKKSGSRPWMSRIVLGQRLLKLRKDAHKTRADVAEARGGISVAHLRRIEEGKVPIHIRNITTLCEIYQVDDGVFRDQLYDIAEATTKRGWYEEEYNLPTWMRIFVDLEAEASVISHYLENVIDGRFQTEAYARAMTEATLPPGSGSTVDEIVEFRMKRKERFWSGYDWRRLHIILTETAVSIQVGSTEIHRQQLDHLLNLAEHDRVTVSIVPHTAGPYFGRGVQFVLLDFDDKNYPSVAYDEDIMYSRYSDDPRVVEQRSGMWTNANKRSISIKEFIGEHRTLHEMEEVLTQPGRSTVRDRSSSQRCSADRRQQTVGHPDDRRSRLRRLHRFAEAAELTVSASRGR